jgi:hypothetical protein
MTMVEQKERTLDYIAILFADACRWHGLKWSPGAVDWMREAATEWGISQVVVDVATAHGHTIVIPS